MKTHVGPGAEVKQALSDAHQALEAWIADLRIDHAGDSADAPMINNWRVLDNVCMLAVVIRLEKRLQGLENAIKDLTFEMKNRP